MSTKDRIVVWCSMMTVALGFATNVAHARMEPPILDIECGGSGGYCMWGTISSYCANYGPDAACAMIAAFCDYEMGSGTGCGVTGDCAGHGVGDTFSCSFLNA